jgi:hypothetical protein
LSIDLRLPPSPLCRHPEKNAFEFGGAKHVPHSPAAVEVTQAVANLLVGLARRSRHAPASRADEEALLIYNWNEGLTYSGRRRAEGGESDFDEAYVFPDAGAFMAREGALRARWEAELGAAAAA